MKIYLLAFALTMLSSVFALADEEIKASSIRFTPHISAEAYTRDQWGFSVQRSVGANLNTNFLLSSFSVALTNRVEVGLSLRGTASLKYNFWRDKEFMWSLGISYLRVKRDTPEVLLNNNNQSINIDVSAAQMLLNYFPTWTKFRFGLNVNAVHTKVSNIVTLAQPLSFGSTWEMGVDISHPFKKHFDYTVGLGWLRETGVTSYERVRFGSGLSLRWYRDKKLFSSPTLGAHYTFATQDIQFLFSTSIY